MINKFHKNGPAGRRRPSFFHSQFSKALWVLKFFQLWEKPWISGTKRPMIEKAKKTG